MPQKFHMQLFISNNNAQIYNKMNAAISAKKMNIPSSMNSPMISRIHLSKPGCGSCGR